MKNVILSIGFGIILISAGCNREHAEEAFQGYLTESLNELKSQLPEELILLDSLLLDSMSIREKLAETTNLDSIEKYKKMLLEAQNVLKKDISSLDSIHPEIRNLLEPN